MNTRWIVVALLALGLGMALSTAHAANCGPPWWEDCYIIMVPKDDPRPDPPYMDIEILNESLIRTIEEQGTFTTLLEADSLLVIDLNTATAYDWSLEDNRLTEAPVEVNQR